MLCALTGNNMKNKRSWLQSRSKSQKMLHSQTAEHSRKLSVFFFYHYREVRWIFCQFISYSCLKIRPQDVLMRFTLKGFCCKFIKDGVYVWDFIFPGLFRNKSNSLSMWECWCPLAYLWPAGWRLLWSSSGFCKSSTNVTLGYHLCLAFAVSSCQRFKWHNPKQLLIALCVMPTAWPWMPSVRASPVGCWRERLLGGVGCTGIQSSKTIDMLA